MTSVFRITSGLLSQLHDDLTRPHDFAFERVAFLSCRSGALSSDGIVLLAHSMQLVADEDYERSNTMGALLGGAAFRKMLQHCYRHNVSIFHVHRHDHYGRPAFSKIDIEESAKFVPDFFKVRPDQPHGALVLSYDSISGLIWRSRTARPEKMSRFGIVGHRLVEISDGRFK